MAGPPPMRPCSGCEAVDDHPRHVIGTVGKVDLRGIWHLDCHAAAGCVAGTTPPGEPSCAERLDEADHRHGAELAQFFARLREVPSG